MLGIEEGKVIGNGLMECAAWEIIYLDSILNFVLHCYK